MIGGAFGYDKAATYKQEKIMVNISLKLYIASLTPKTDKMINKLNDILAKRFNNEYSFEVIDVAEDHQLAEENDIIATPTLVKSSPPHDAMIIGDINNEKRLLEWLEA